MFDVFGSVKGLIKLDKICIDNNIFRLHYKVRLFITMFSFILSFTQASFIILVTASL